MDVDVKNKRDACIAAIKTSVRRLNMPKNPILATLIGFSFLVSISFPMFGIATLGAITGVIVRLVQIVAFPVSIVWSFFDVLYIAIWALVIHYRGKL